jgi:hypothetical protein
MNYKKPYLYILFSRLETALLSLDRAHGRSYRDEIFQAITEAAAINGAIHNNDLGSAYGRIFRVSDVFARLPADLRGLAEAQARLSNLAAEIKLQSRRADRRLFARIERGAFSRRTRCITGLAVRLLPPTDRARYREEFAAELADLPRRDQAPHAFRLAFRAWSLRRSLTGKPSIRSTRVVIVVGSGACGFAALAASGWPAAFLGSVLIIAGGWVVSSQDRTRRLASLIRAARKK